jgi:3-oxoacid CoA-transferase
VNKLVTSAAEAVKDIGDGATIMCSGFGLCGLPENLIQALVERGSKNLTVVSNNVGTNDFGLVFLLKSGQIKKAISTYVGENKVFEKMSLAGEVEVELNPQGTFSERMRAGGAGVAGFFTPTGYGTPIAEGKEVRWFDGRPYLFETALRRTSRSSRRGRPTARQPGVPAHHAQLRAHDGDGRAHHDRGGRGDRRAGLARPRPRAHARHLRAARRPGRDVREAHREAHACRAARPLDPDPSAERIVKRAALEMKDGYYVNLGIGMPTLASNYVPPACRSCCTPRTACSASGRIPRPARGSRPDQRRQGDGHRAARHSYFSSADSFAMVRGGHVDLTILGALQVDGEGNLANWMIPGKMVKGWAARWTSSRARSASS